MILFQSLDQLQPNAFLSREHHLSSLSTLSTVSDVSSPVVHVINSLVYGENDDLFSII
jgi:hypothetical protein